MTWVNFSGRAPLLPSGPFRSRQSGRRFDARKAQAPAFKEGYPSGVKALWAALLLSVRVCAGGLRVVEPVALPRAPLTAGALALQPPTQLALAPAPAPRALLGPAGALPFPAPARVPAAAVPAGPSAPAGAAAGAFAALTQASAPAGKSSGPAAASPEAGAEEGAARLSGRFDGSALLTTTERVPGGRVERSAYRARDGGTTWVSRSVINGRYEAHEHLLSRAPRVTDAPRASLTARLEDGVLTVSLRGGDAGAFEGRAELRRALSKFGAGVRAIASADAAVGRWAAEAGFSRVIVPESGSRRTLFVRPRDAVTGRDGKVWRRARVSRTREGLLERYENGGRVVLLDRRPYGVYEFHGDALPKPGTPADAMIVLSRGADGKVSSFVRDDRALVLDAAAERDAF
jgi:hypothetical protein